MNDILTLDQSDTIRLCQCGMDGHMRPVTDGVCEHCGLRAPDVVVLVGHDTRECGLSEIRLEDER